MWRWYYYQILHQHTEGVKQDFFKSRCRLTAEQVAREYGIEIVGFREVTKDFVQREMRGAKTSDIYTYRKPN